MERNHNAFMPMKLSLLTAWQQDFEQVQRVPLAHRQAGLFSCYCIRPDNRK
jgi:hypothetical protein